MQMRPISIDHGAGKRVSVSISDFLRNRVALPPFRGRQSPPNLHAGADYIIRACTPDSNFMIYKHDEDKEKNSITIITLFFSYIFHIRCTFNIKLYYS